VDVVSIVTATDGEIAMSADVTVIIILLRLHHFVEDNIPLLHLRRQLASGCKAFHLKPLKRMSQSSFKRLV